MTYKDYLKHIQSVADKSLKRVQEIDRQLMEQTEGFYDSDLIDERNEKYKEWQKLTNQVNGLTTFILENQIDFNQEMPSGSN